jgi:hypothetical protein
VIYRLISSVRGFFEKPRTEATIGEKVCLSYLLDGFKDKRTNLLHIYDYVTDGVGYVVVREAYTQKIYRLDVTELSEKELQSLLNNS